MKKTFLSLLLLAACQLTVAQTHINALFVGNSYTHVNDLPSLIQQMAASGGDTLTHQSNTPGGCTFGQHCNNNSMTLIRRGGWDVVVLQEQSQNPSLPDNYVQAECLPLAKRLVDSVYANNPCANPVFYMTWGRKNGDTATARYFSFPLLGTYNGMDSLLALRYMMMKEDNDASVSPVGKVWHYIRDSFPSIELYQADESHPSLIGSFAAACSFYAVMFRKDPTTVSYSSTLDSATAAIVKQVAKTVVYDSLDKWLRPRPIADFAFADAASGVSFTNNSQKADSYLWDFADGTTDTAANPTHRFPMQGTFNVKLIAMRHCNVTDTITKAVTVNAGVGISTATEAAIDLYPNPATNYLRISGLDNATRIAVLYADGKKVLETNISGNTQQIDTKSFAQGIYIVEISNGQGLVARKKFIKK